MHIELNLERQLKAVESKLQTTAHLDTVKEKQMVSEAKDISSKIMSIRNKYSKGDFASSHSEFRIGIDSLKSKIAEIQNKKSQIQKEIDQRRIRINQSFSERRELFKNKDLLKSELPRLINTISNINEKIKEVRISIKQKERRREREEYRTRFNSKKYLPIVTSIINIAKISIKKPMNG